MMRELDNMSSSNKIMGAVSFGGGGGGGGPHDPIPGPGPTPGVIDGTTPEDTETHILSQGAQGTIDNGGNPFPPNCWNSGCHGPDNYDPYN